MKRFFLVLLLAAGFVALLAGCAAAPTQNAAQLAANVQKQVVKQCAVVQPFLSSMTAMQSQLSADAQAQLAQTSADVSKVCAFANVAASGVSVSFSLADVQTFANSAMPSLIRLIDLSPLNGSQKVGAELALTAAQLAVSTAIAEAQ